MMFRSPAGLAETGFETALAPRCLNRSDPWSQMLPRHREGEGKDLHSAMRGVPKQSGQVDANPAAGDAPRLIEVIEARRPMPAHLRGAVIALGNFDGFHLGHQKVVGQAIEMARTRGVAAIVATFDPHPVDYFKPNGSPFGLSTLRQRRRLLASAGADAMMIFRFDGALAAVTPEVFVQTWLETAGGVVTGENFTFGRGRAGNIHTLAALGAKQAMVSTAVAPVTCDQEIVSSTRIRDALRIGDCKTAARLLGRPFTVEGSLETSPESAANVVTGRASLRLGSYLRPASGLYAVRATGVSGVARNAVARIHEQDAAAELQDAIEIYLPGRQNAAAAAPVELAFLDKIGPQ